MAVFVVSTVSSIDCNVKFDLRLKLNLGSQLGGYGPWWQSTVFSCFDEEFIGCSRFFGLII